MPKAAWTQGAEEGTRYPAAQSQFTLDSQFTTDSQRAAGHADALLGWHRRASDGTECVILHKPWGSNPSRASCPQGSSATSRTHVPALAGSALNAADAFGTPADLFTQCFNAVPWQG